MKAAISVAVTTLDKGLRWARSWSEEDPSMIVMATDERASKVRSPRMVIPAGVIGTILALALFVSVPAEAGTPTDTLRNVFTVVNTVLTGPIREDQLAERVLAVRGLLSPILDFRNAATRALGDEWWALTGAEQDEFVKVFTDLLERSCVAQVALVAARSGGMRVDYLDEAIDGDGAMVWTAIVRKGGGEVLFDYAMVRHEERWLVRDIFVEGVSLVSNLRAQFRRVLRDSSYPELVIRMKVRTMVYRTRFPGHQRGIST